MWTLSFLSGAYNGVGTQYDTRSEAGEEFDSHISGTVKNFYESMIKTNLFQIVPKLPFPLSDMVNEVFKTYKAMNDGARDTASGHLHTLLIAELDKAAGGSWAKKYAGNEAHTGTAYIPASSFKKVILGWGHTKYDNGVRSNSPIGRRAPPANIYANPNVAGQYELVVVCEFRYQTENLNRCFDDAYPVTVAVDVDKATYCGQQITKLAAAATDFRAGAAQALPALPAPP